MAIHPRAQGTRVLVTEGVVQTLVKAQLSVRAQHPRALQTLVEAIALWQGEAVHAALVADGPAERSGTNLFADSLGLGDSSPLYRLDVVSGFDRRRRRNRLDGMGDFRDLRQLLLWEVAK